MIKNLFSSQLRINMASGVVVTVINTAAMMVAFPIYLHFLGYEKYGVWLVLATVLSFAQLGNLGIGQAVMKLVAEEHGRGDIEGIQRYVTTALALLCLSGSLALIAVLVFKTQIISAFKLSDENAKTALWLLPYIGILSIYVFIVQALNATLSGLGRMDLANYAQSIGRIVAVAVVAVLLYSGRGIESLLIGNILSYVFIHVMSLICIWRIANIRLLRLRNLDAQRGKRLLRFGGTVFGGSLINMLFSPFNKLMLSRYAGVSTIPIYEIAFRGSMQIRNMIEAGLRALMPEISRIGANMTENAKGRISQIYRRAMKLIFAFGLPLYASLIIASPLLLRLWLGDKFVETLPSVFQIMLVGTFLSLLCVPAYYTLLGLGKVGCCFVAHAIIGIVNLVALGTIILLMESVTIRSVALVVVLSMAVSTFYLLWQYYHVMRKLVLDMSDHNCDESASGLSVSGVSRESIS
ncbi:MAG: oligosaccharide flippase family protein [Phycisphaerae bacterium]|nr:oligosaccharide flippase family protein [Phycisphaerae bacterium]